eukprot:3580952-Alexandrium_andersonii.AAC.1
MSASLVGSEMCIRDRLRPPARGAPKQTVVFSYFDSRSLSADAHSRCATCLLYTSDAADDM